MAEVSIIIPSYNHARFIGETIESVQRQTFSDWELIIVEDASSDQSRAVINTYQREDPRIGVLIHDVNMGMSKSINEAMERATGRFLVLGASDDVFMPNKLQDQLAVISRPGHQEEIVLGTGIEIDEQGRDLGPVFMDDGLKRQGDVFEDLLRAGYLYVSIQAMLIPRELVTDIRWDEALRTLNEYKFALDLARLYRFYQMEVPVFKHRLHGANQCCHWDHDRVAHERARLAEEYLQSEEDRLSLPTRQRLYEFMIIDGLIRGDHTQVRELTLQWLLWVPDTLHAVREALLQTHREPNITLTFDRGQERVVSLNMAEVGIGLSDVLALNATPISIHNH